MRRFIVSFLVLNGVLSLVHAEPPDLLFVRPWVELEPVVRVEPGPYPIPVAAAEKSVLDEGRVLFSAMVYGWTFTYFPGDRSRKVQESFELLPVAQVPWGSPHLRVRETTVDDTRLWARMSYALDDDESLRRSAWESNTAALSTGQGKASVMQGPGAKMGALRDAVRDAIRRSLDVRYVNKPREITGEAVLWDDPECIVRAGFYFTTARVKLMVRELVPYRIF
jgi:hypothetical protein